MIKTILWDVDGTLLDFDAAQQAAIKTLFQEFGLGECTDAMLERYSDINNSFWKRLEKNEVSRQQVLIRGGMNAGIKTCWYDPEKKPVPDNYQIDYVIYDLHELADLL